jgi:uncharacterized protein YjbJ (UPF0337 family)
MSSDRIEGKVKNGIGQAEAAAGEVVGDPGLQLRGESRQFEGSVQEGVGAAKERVKGTAKKAREVVASATDQAQDAYQTVKTQAKSVADTVDPFVRRRPYAALGVAMLGGFVLGALLRGGGPKVIYVKTPRT